MTGRLISLHRWPVKSFAGEALDAARVGPRGLAGDRVHALVDPRDPRRRPVSARQVPRVLEWAAAYDGAPVDDPDDPPLPVVAAPDGRRLRWDDPELPAALAEHVGRTLELSRSPRGHHDVRGTLLVTTEATRRAVEEALGRPLDVRRFRTNLHLDLDAPAYAEEEWPPGARIEVGQEVVLRVREACDRCAVPTRDPDRPAERWPDLLRWLNRHHTGFFGVRADVEPGGAVRVGDAVAVRGGRARAA